MHCPQKLIMSSKGGGEPRLSSPICPVYPLVWLNQWEDTEGSEPRSWELEKQRPEVKWGNNDP